MAHTGRQHGASRDGLGPYLCTSTPLCSPPPPPQYTSAACCCCCCCCCECYTLRKTDQHYNTAPKADAAAPVAVGMVPYKQLTWMKARSAYIPP
jgi:hypothetical protein